MSGTKVETVALNLDPFGIVPIFELQSTDGSKSKISARHTGVGLFGDDVADDSIFGGTDVLKLDDMRVKNDLMIIKSKNNDNNDSDRDKGNDSIKIENKPVFKNVQKKTAKKLFDDDDDDDDIFGEKLGSLSSQTINNKLNLSKKINQLKGSKMLFDD